MIAGRSLVVTGQSLPAYRAARPRAARQSYRPDPVRAVRASAAPRQRLVEDRLGDRAGELTTRARGDLGVGALQHHGDRVLRIVGRGEGDDPGVRPLGLARRVELG